MPHPRTSRTIAPYRTPATLVRNSEYLQATSEPKVRRHLRTLRAKVNTKVNAIKRYVHTPRSAYPHWVRRDLMRDKSKGIENLQPLLSDCERRDEEKLRMVKCGSEEED